MAQPHTALSVPTAIAMMMVVGSMTAAHAQQLYAPWFTDVSTTKIETADFQPANVIEYQFSQLTQRVFNSTYFNRDVGGLCWCRDPPPFMYGSSVVMEVNDTSEYTYDIQMAEFKQLASNLKNSLLPPTYSGNGYLLSYLRYGPAAVLDKNGIVPRPIEFVEDGVTTSRDYAAYRAYATPNQVVIIDGCKPQTSTTVPLKDACTGNMYGFLETPTDACYPTGWFPINSSYSSAFMFTDEMTSYIYNKANSNPNELGTSYGKVISSYPFQVTNAPLEILHNISDQYYILHPEKIPAVCPYGTLELANGIICNTAPVTTRMAPYYTLINGVLSFYDSSTCEGNSAGQMEYTFEGVDLFINSAREFGISKSPQFRDSDMTPLQPVSETFCTSYNDTSNNMCSWEPSKCSTEQFRSENSPTLYKNGSLSDVHRFGISRMAFNDSSVSTVNTLLINRLLMSEYYKSLLSWNLYEDYRSLVVSNATSYFFDEPTFHFWDFWSEWSSRTWADESASQIVGLTENTSTGIDLSTAGCGVSFVNVCGFNDVMPNGTSMVPIDGTFGFFDGPLFPNKSAYYSNIRASFPGMAPMAFYQSISAGFRTQEYDCSDLNFTVPDFGDIAAENVQHLTSQDYTCQDPGECVGWSFCPDLGMRGMCHVKTCWVCPQGSYVERDAMTLPPVSPSKPGSPSTFDRRNEYTKQALIATYIITCITALSLLLTTLYKAKGYLQGYTPL